MLIYSVLSHEVFNVIRKLSETSYIIEYYGDPLLIEISEELWIVHSGDADKNYGGLK